MDRRIVYIGAIPQDIDVLQSNLDPYIAVSKLADAVLGKTQILNNFLCVPTSPTTMTVNVGFGEIYSLQQVDTSNYGSITTNSNEIVKQGVTFGTTNLSCPAPGTIGYSVNYLVQITINEQDTNSVVLPYYNSADINNPLPGPGGSGDAQNTVRQDGVTVSVKTGIAAPTGTQTTPSPDSGYTGAYVVTVAYGQTTIISGNISVYSAASFINETLTQKVSIPTGDLRWAQIARVQSGFYWFGADTGTTNSVVTSLSPAISGYSQGNIFHVLIANTNTGASTINVNSVGALNIKLINGNAINPGDLLAGMLAEFEYDGTNVQLLNPATTVLATQIQNSSFIYAVDTGSANTYVAAPSPALTSYSAGQYFIIKISNTNTAASTINLSSLGAKNIKLSTGAAVNVGDLVSGQIAGLVYDGTNFQLLNPASWASQNQVQNGSLVYAADGGSANTYTATLSPAPAAYTTGMEVRVKISNKNTSASTLNLNSLGAKNIKLGNGNAINAGDLLAGMLAEFSYDGTNFQLMNAGTSIKKINTQIFTSSGTYTPSSGLVYADVRIVAGGGGGGGCEGVNSQSSAAGGGGGGGYSQKLFSAANIGASQSITIGAGGAGGLSGANNGSSGGTTSFGSLLSATGGLGGNGALATTGTSGVAPGQGGTGSGGDVNTSGGTGGAGYTIDLNTVITGRGGGSSLFASEKWGEVGTTTPGNSYGGGGCGAASNNGSATSQAGGAGAAGVVIVTEYLSG